MLSAAPPAVLTKSLRDRFSATVHPPRHVRLPVFYARMLGLGLVTLPWAASAVSPHSALGLVGVDFEHEVDFRLGMPAGSGGGASVRHGKRAESSHIRPVRPVHRERRRLPSRRW